MSTLGTFDWAICIGYLCTVLGISLVLARGQHNSDDYFVAGRSMHWLPIGLSLFVGSFSSLSFVGLPSEAAYRDYHLFLSILFIPFVVAPIVWYLFLPLYFRLGVTSAYEYVERRFNRRLRIVCSILFMLYMIGWMGNLLRTIGVLMQAVFVMSASQTVLVLVGVGLFATVYTTIGGVKAVVWTDAIQAIALGGGMLIVFFIALNKIDGGWENVWKIGSEHGRFEMFRTEFDWETNNLYGAFMFGFFVYLSTHSVSFTSVQRFMSTPSIGAARSSLLLSALMSVLVCGLFFGTGSVMFAFYHQPSARASGAATANQGLPSGGLTQVPASNLYDELSDAKNQDHLLPRFVMTVIPRPGLMGVLLAGLFAAAMSSVDSGINSMTASIVSDWMPGRELALWKIRVCCLMFGIAAVVAAVTFFYRGGNVFPLIMKIAGMFFGLILAIFLLGILVKRADSISVGIGLIAGTLTLASTFAFPISHWWYGAITCIPTFVVGVIASMVLPTNPTRDL